MKTQILFAAFFVPLFLISCEKEYYDKLKGDQSALGEVGVTVSSTVAEVAGVSSINGEVVALRDGISTIRGSAQVTNSNIKNIVSNFQGAEVEGNTVTITDLKFKATEKGIAAVTGLAEGIIVEYDAEPGDEYKTADGGVRTVVSRSVDDDYLYGFFLIKVIEVRENLNKYGVKQIRYWANHRFGLVGIEFTFDDNSIARYPVYFSAEN